MKSLLPALIVLCASQWAYADPVPIVRGSTVLKSSATGIQPSGQPIILPSAELVPRLPAAAGKVRRTSDMHLRSGLFIAHGNTLDSVCVPVRSQFACTKLIDQRLMTDITVGTTPTSAGETGFMFKVDPASRRSKASIRAAIELYLRNYRQRSTQIEPLAIKPPPSSVVKPLNDCEYEAVPRRADSCVYGDAGKGQCTGGGGYRKPTGFDDPGCNGGGGVGDNPGDNPGGDPGGSGDPGPQYPPDPPAPDPGADCAADPNCQKVPVPGTPEPGYDPGPGTLPPPGETCGAEQCNDAGGVGGSGGFGAVPVGCVVTPIGFICTAKRTGNAWWLGPMPWFPQSWCDYANVLCSGGQEPRGERDHTRVVEGCTSGKTYTQCQDLCDAQATAEWIELSAYKGAMDARTRRAKGEEIERRRSACYTTARDLTDDGDHPVP